MEAFTQFRDRRTGIHPLYPTRPALPSSFLARSGLFLRRVLVLPLVGLAKGAVAAPILAMLWALTTLASCRVVSATVGTRCQWWLLRYVQYWLTRGILFMLGVWHINYSVVSAMGQELTPAQRSEHTKGVRLPEDAVGPHDAVLGAGSWVEPLYLAPWTSPFDVLVLMQRLAPVFVVPVGVFDGFPPHKPSKLGVSVPPNLPTGPVDQVVIVSPFELMWQMIRPRGFVPYNENDPRAVSLRDAAPANVPIVMFVEGVPSNGNAVLYPPPVLPHVPTACAKYMAANVCGRRLGGIGLVHNYKYTSAHCVPGQSTFKYVLGMLGQLSVRLHLREVWSVAVDTELKRSILKGPTDRGILSFLLSVASGGKSLVYTGAADYEVFADAFVKFQEQRGKRKVVGKKRAR